MKNVYSNLVIAIASLALIIGCDDSSSSSKTPESGGVMTSPGGATTGAGGSMMAGAASGGAATTTATPAGGTPTQGGQAQGGAPAVGGTPAAGGSDTGGQMGAGGMAGGQATGGQSAGGQMAGGQSAAGGADEVGGQMAMGGMITPEFMPNLDCANNDACMEPFQRCVANKCAYDLVPDVFRLSEVDVTAPMGSAMFLTGVLNNALETNMLNLLIEPGGYNDNGYRWYVGNAGRFEDGSFDYYKTDTGTNLYPVQNFDGVWRQAEGVEPHWTLEGDTVFVLNVPAGTAMVGGEEVTCFVTFNVNVTLMMTPKINPETMAPFVDISITGVLKASDIADVKIPVNGIDIPLLEVLDNDRPSIDTDGDGDPDAFPFVLTGKANKIRTHENFDFPRAENDPRGPPNRSPMAMDNPDGCGG